MWVSLDPNGFTYLFVMEYNTLQVHSPWVDYIIIITQIITAFTTSFRLHLVVDIDCAQCIHTASWSTFTTEKLIYYHLINNQMIICHVLHQ